MTIYESIVILDSLMPPKDIDAAIERFSSIITTNKGKIRKVEKWGKKRLAYEIQKKQYGFYVSIEFEGEGDIAKELQSDYNYNDKVLRYLTYRYDKYKLKAMRSAEKTEEPSQSSAPAPEPAVPAVEPEAPVETEPAEASAEQPEEKTVEESPSREEKE